MGSESRVVKLSSARLLLSLVSSTRPLGSTEADTWSIAPIADARSWSDIDRGSIRIRRRFGNLEISEQLPRSYVAWALAITSVVFGVWFGAAVPTGTGLRTLLWLNAPEWGLLCMPNLRWQRSHPIASITVT